MNALRINTIYWFAIALLVVVTTEVMLFVMVRYMNVDIIDVSMYKRLELDDKAIERYLNERDSVLGWPGEGWIAANTEDYGARISPANRGMRQIRPCVSVYGDSFAFSGEVAPEYAWTERLAGKLGCPVLNYGVVGYGVDQAVMRFEHNNKDNAQFTILSIYPHDINRNLTQWFHLITAKSYFGFKPRYKIVNGQLTVVPLPAGTKDQIKLIFSNPGIVLKDEYYLPGISEARHAKVVASFPYTKSMLKVIYRKLLHYNNINIGQPVTTWNNPPWFFDEKGPKDEVVELNDQIIGHFLDICSRKNRECAILMLPGLDSLFKYKVDGSTLLSLIYKNIGYDKIWDATGYFIKSLKSGGICYYVGVNRDCAGHYNKDGYNIIAEYVYRKIAPVM